MGQYVQGAAVAAAVCVPVAYYMYGRHMRAKMNLKIQARGKEARDNLEALWDDLATHAADIDNNLVHLSFRDLQRGLQDGTITATAALRAYQAAALKLNDEVNAITDVLVDAATIASRLDSLPASERGPLHGVPISLKECCKIKGQDRTVGFGELIDVPCEDDAVLIKVLKAQGAVPFIRTNLPQGMCGYACVNPIYGKTSNPHASTRSPGGSSGGEGAMIGGNGSILGVGSDIGGSIRLPAYFCGTFALKPTAGRLSLDGNFDYGSLEAQTMVRPTDGPLGRDVDSLVQFMEAVLCPEHFNLNPETPPIPFRREIYESRRSLKIGFYVYDECTRCVPAVERAVMLAKSTLQSLGHTLVEIKPYKVSYAFTKIFMPAFIGDDCQGHKELVKYDDTCMEMYGLYHFNRKSYYERWLWAKLEEAKGYNPMVIEAMKREPLRTLNDWFLRQNEAKRFRQEFTNTWRDQGLDAVICPVLPGVALTSGLETPLLSAATYTILYNVVNYPAGVVPVTKVTKSDVTKTMDPSIYNAETGLEKIIQKDSEGTEGLSVGIQVVGLPYTEELVLRLMTELDGALKADMDR